MDLRDLWPQAKRREPRISRTARIETRIIRVISEIRGFPVLKKLAAKGLFLHVCIPENANFYTSFAAICWLQLPIHPRRIRITHLCVKSNCAICVHPWFKLWLPLPGCAAKTAVFFRTTAFGEL
jgi:hypothetical protein